MDTPLVPRMRRFGTTIFAEMSQLATRTGAVNLGQGFPDTDGPALIKDAAERAIATGDGGANQYPPGRGVPALREAVAEHQRTRYGLELDAETQSSPRSARPRRSRRACSRCAHPATRW